MMSSEKPLMSERKRPLDPEETGTVTTESYWEPLPKRPRAIEEDLSCMLSMKAPDPPGHSLCGKRKISDDESEHATKSARSGGLGLPACDPEARAPQEKRNEEKSPDEGCDDNMSVESECSSISEGAIKNAFFHLAFGRRGSNPSQRSTGNVDAVDSRIEDLIRRSRLEATIKSQSKQRKPEGMDIDVDDDEAREEDEHAKSCDWLPGHG